MQMGGKGGEGVLEEGGVGGGGRGGAWGKETAGTYAVLPSPE